MRYNFASDVFFFFGWRFAVKIMLLDAAIGHASKAWQLALQNIEDKRETSTPKVSDFGNSIALCGKAAHWRKASEILRGYAIRRLESNTISYNATISACEKGGIWTSSLCILEELDSQGLEASVVTNSAAIKALGSCRERWSRAMSLLGRTCKFLQPNAITYTAAISIYEKSSRWHLALNSLEKMALRFVQSHVFALNSCMASCEEQWHVASQLCHSWNVRRDVATYNACLTALVNGGGWQQGLQQLRELQIVLLEATVISYNSAISAFERVSRWDYAVLLFQELPLRRLQANITTCNTLISALEKSEAWHQALHLVAHMQVWHVQADVISYNASITACEKASVWQQSLWLLLNESQLERDIFGYNSAATSCVKSFRWQNAMAILQHRRIFKEPLDAVSCAAGLDAFGKVASWQSGFWWMTELLQSHVKLDIVAYNRAISAFDTEADWRRSCGLLDSLHMQKLQTNVVTSNAEIGVCGTKWNKIFHIIADLDLRHLQPTLLTHNSAVQASTCSDQWQLAILRFKRLDSKFWPDILTYHFGMAAFEKGHQCLDAVCLIDAASQIAIAKLQKGVHPELNAPMKRVSKEKLKLDTWLYCIMIIAS